MHGFRGYPASGPWPTLLEVLQGVPPANTPEVIVDLMPGLAFRYSGGGTTIAQQVVVDVLGRPFPGLMRDLILDPLGMADSTFEQPLPAPMAARAAVAHPLNGQPLAGGANIYPEMAAAGQLGVRIDTAGSRFVEGLDPPASYAVLERHVPEAIRGYRSEAELRYLVGAGVSAAACYHVRDALDADGFRDVKLVASSGFDPAKCRVMAEAQAPIDVIGTGSYLPQRWTETYATADIVEYDGKPLVKVGREFLLRK